MFTGTLTKMSSGETEDLCLFRNPSGNTKKAYQIFFKIDFTSSLNSIWEFYHNPTVINNGIIQTVTKIEGGIANNTISLYKAPVISTNGNPLRRFIIQANIKEFSSRVPMITLEPGNSILVRRLNQRMGNIECTWIWNEINA